MNELMPCPFCGEKVKEKIAGGVHFYECQNLNCRATTSFVGETFCGVVHGCKMYEAENPLERYNRRGDDIVPVVRCKDCSKYVTRKCHFCSFDENGYCTGGPMEDFYCADAVKIDLEE